METKAIIHTHSHTDTPTHSNKSSSNYTKIEINTRINIKQWFRTRFIDVALSNHWSLIKLLFFLFFVDCTSYCYYLFSFVKLKFERVAQQLMSKSTVQRPKIFKNELSARIESERERERARKKEEKNVTTISCYLCRLTAISRDEYLKRSCQNVCIPKIAFFLSYREHQLKK